MYALYILTILCSGNSWQDSLRAIQNLSLYAAIVSHWEEWMNLVSPEPTAARRRDIQILHRKSGVRAIFASFQTRIFIEINTKSVLLILSNPYFCDVFSSVCQPIILNQIIYYLSFKYANTYTWAFTCLGTRYNNYYMLRIGVRLYATAIFLSFISSSSSNNTYILVFF
jgi:hypothetical protein